MVINLLECYESELWFWDKPVFQNRSRIAKGNEFRSKYLEKENCQFYDQHNSTEHIQNDLYLNTQIKNVYSCKNDI